MIRKFCWFMVFILAVALLVGCQAAKDDAETFAANQRLGRGVNFGNALDGPREGAWGLYLKEEYFVAVAEAGFETIRLPIRWAKYADVYEPYEISETILDRVEWAIDQALANDLNIIINIHHFEAIVQMPEIQIDRLVAIWKQIGERYQDYPDNVYFEILNEPHENLTNDLWNPMIPEVLAVIRASNPDRYVIVGGGDWNNISGLETLEIPADDRRIIGTFHYYSPHDFTHQGAAWSSANDRSAVDWGSEADLQELQAAFDIALAWSEKENRPLFMGEFGTYSAAPMDARITWTSAVRAEAEKRGFSWTYWDFGTDFAVYNLGTKEWREPILKALIPE